MLRRCYFTMQALQSFEFYQKTGNEFYLDVGSEFIYLAFEDLPLD